VMGTCAPAGMRSTATAAIAAITRPATRHATARACQAALSSQVLQAPGSALGALAQGEVAGHPVVARRPLA
jgi:hypothetical protein